MITFSSLTTRGHDYLRLQIDMLQLCSLYSALALNFVLASPSLVGVKKIDAPRPNSMIVVSQFQDK